MQKTHTICFLNYDNKNPQIIAGKNIYISVCHTSIAIAKYFINEG